jgi:hypothetical protein
MLGGDFRKHCSLHRYLVLITLGCKTNIHKQFHVYSELVARQSLPHYVRGVPRTQSTLATKVKPGFFAGFA